MGMVIERVQTFKLWLLVGQNHDEEPAKMKKPQKQSKKTSNRKIQFEDVRENVHFIHLSLPNNHPPSRITHETWNIKSVCTVPTSERAVGLATYLTIWHLFRKSSLKYLPLPAMGTKSTKSTATGAKQTWKRSQFHHRNCHGVHEMGWTKCTQKVLYSTV